MRQMAPPGGELTSYFNSEYSITLNWQVLLALWPPIGNFSRREEEKKKINLAPIDLLALPQVIKLIIVNKGRSMKG